MPTYEFTCRDCEHHFEVFTSISRKAGVVCPKCEGRDLQEALGVIYIGGSLSNPGAGTGGSCSHGSCTTCGSGCKH